MYKYKINEFLNNLTVRDHKKVLLEIHEILGISRNTFRNYAYIPKNSKKDIPYCIVRKIEILFGMQNGDLINQKFVGKHYTMALTKIPLKPTRKPRAKILLA